MSLSRELLILILQFLDEEKFKDTVHKLEQESGVFFDMRHFEAMGMNGDWDEAEKYLSGFTKVNDNRYSMKVYFEIRKQKYLEALDKNNRDKAVEILRKDLKDFPAINEILYKEFTYLLSLTNFRENEQLSRYGDTKSSRALILREVKKLLEVNPLIRDKLKFPIVEKSRLRTLIKQSLNWQHKRCKNPKPTPDIKTLFTDHCCGSLQPNGAHAPYSVTSPLVLDHPPHGVKAYQQAQAAPGPRTTTAVGRVNLNLPSHSGLLKRRRSPANTLVEPGYLPVTSSLVPDHQPGYLPVTSSLVPDHPPGFPPHDAHKQARAAQGLRTTTVAGPANFNLPTHYGPLKRPRSLTITLAEFDYFSKRTRHLGQPDEANNRPGKVVCGGSVAQSHGQSSKSSDKLPKTVVMTLDVASAVTTMEFHPSTSSLLLAVGTNMGIAMLWDLVTQKPFAVRFFMVWDTKTSMNLQTPYSVSVNRVIWSPDGSMFGVAFSKQFVHIYSYHGGDDLRNHLEINAHIGNVNDIAFASPDNRLAIVTCGDDQLIKVWDVATGARIFKFAGHQSAVYSLCPRIKENIEILYSSGKEGKIQAWLYDDLGYRLDYDAPGPSPCRMVYTSDGARLFACGTKSEGDSYLVECSENKAAIKQAYKGLSRRPEEMVQFDLSKSGFLAAGDESIVKIWDMDNINMLTTIDAEGGLLASPCIRFNKDGSLLAVSTKENGIKILANSDGSRMLRAPRQENPSRIETSSTSKPLPMLNSGVNDTQAASNNVTLADNMEPATMVHNAESATLVGNKESATPVHNVESATFLRHVEPATLVHNLESATVERNVESTTLVRDVESATPLPPALAMNEDNQQTTNAKAKNDHKERVRNMPINEIQVRKEPGILKMEDASAARLFVNEYKC